MNFQQVLMAAATQGGGAQAGPSYGPEIITDGGFANAPSWTNDDGYWTVSAGKAVVNDPDGDGDLLYQLSSITLTNGMTIHTVFTIDSISGLGAGVRAFVGGIGGTYRNAPGTYTEDIVTNAASQNVGLQDTLGVTVASCDNLSMKQVL